MWSRATRTRSIPAAATAGLLAGPHQVLAHREPRVCGAANVVYLSCYDYYGRNGMRDWVWRSLTYAVAGCAGSVGPLMPSDPDRARSEGVLEPMEADFIFQKSKRTRRWRRGRRREELALECEAFLTGRCFDSLCEIHARRCPDWAWVNVLAHADRAELERLATLRTSGRDPLALLSYLADEVLLTAGLDESRLRILQHDRLVPLELLLLHRPTVGTPSPTLAKMVRRELEIPRRPNRAVA